ncbi:MAG: BON domain-containing protein [Verrucomicrobiota bacterium]
MKSPKLFFLGTFILAVVGCAHHDQQQARFDDTLYTPAFASQAAPPVYPSATALGFPNSNAANSEDSALVSRVTQALIEDSNTAPLLPTLNISADNGVVTLSGSVTSDEQKQAVESAVQQISGVAAVNNRLQVSSETAAVQSGSATPGSTLESAESTADEALVPTSRTNSLSAVYPPGSNQVETATEPLTPTATRPSEGNTNENASAESGRNGPVVVNVQGSSQSDRTLAQQISQELRTNASLASAISQVSISVVDGQVTVRGAVKNAEQKREIEAAIHRATGVSSVDNQLRVNGDQSAPINP